MFLKYVFILKIDPRMLDKIYYITCIFSHSNIENAIDKLTQSNTSWFVVFFFQFFGFSGILLINSLLGIVPDYRL